MLGKSFEAAGQGGAFEVASQRGIAFHDHMNCGCRSRARAGQCGVCRAHFFNGIAIAPRDQQTLWAVWICEGTTGLEPIERRRSRIPWRTQSVVIAGHELRKTLAGGVKRRLDFVRQEQATKL